jgi:hypothetical protein
MSTKTGFAIALGLSLALAAPTQRADAGIKEEIEAYRKQKAEEEKREAAEKKAKEEAEKKEEAERKAKAGPSISDMVKSRKSSMDEILKAKLKGSSGPSTTPTGGSGMEEMMRKKREDTWKADREKAEKESFLYKAQKKIESWRDGIKNIGKKKEEEKEKTLLDEYKEQKAKEGGSVWDMMKKKTEKK